MKTEDNIMLSVLKKEQTTQALEFIIYIKTILYVYMFVWFTICPFLKFTNIYILTILHSFSLYILYNNNLSNYLLALKRVKNIRITNNIDYKNILILCEDTIIQDYDITDKYLCFDNS